MPARALPNELRTQYMTLNTVKPILSASVLGLLLGLLCLAGPPAAQGQLWLQTVRVIIPIRTTCP